MKPRQYRPLLIAAGFSVAGMSHSLVSAANISWDGGGDATTLDLSTNWAGDVLPSGAVPDTAVFDGTAGGTLGLTYTGSGFGDTAGLNMLVSGTQTAAVAIDSGSNISSLRLNNLSIDSGAGSVTLGNSADTFNLTLGSAAGQIHTWANESSNTAVIGSDVRFGLGGAGSHALLFTGSGNWSVGALLTPTNTANLSIHKTGTGELSLSGGGTLTAGVTAYGGSFAAVLKEGTTRITAGTYSANNTEFVVGGLDTVGTNTQFIMDGGSLGSISWLSIGRGNGTGLTTSTLVLNNSAAVTPSNVSAGFNAGNASTAPKGGISLNNTASLTLGSGGAFHLAESAGSNMTLSLKNSATVTLTGTPGSDNNRNIGFGGTGTVNIADSATFTDASTRFLNIGRDNGIGVVNVTGGTFDKSGGEIRIGTTGTNGAYTGSGIMNVSGGTVNIGALTLARGNNNQALVTGTINVTGGTVNAGSTGDVILGYAGNNNLGKIVVDGGTFNMGTTAKRWLVMQYYDTARGQIDVNSGNFNLNFNTDIRFSRGNASSAGTNVINLNGGAMTAYSGLATGAGSTAVVDLAYSGAATANNTFNLNGGTLAIGQVVTTSNTPVAIFNFNGGTLRPTIAGANFLDLGGASQRANVRNGGALIDSNGLDITIPQALLHSNIGGDNAVDGGLTKLGSGRLALSSAATYTGPTSVNAGTLALGGSLATSGVTVASGAALSSGSSIAGSVTSSGQLLPGGSGTYGTMTIGGGLTLTGGTLNLDLNGTNNATGGGVNDLFAVTGNVGASGTVIVSPSFSSTPAPATTYTFATYTGSLTGGTSFAAGSRAVTIDTTTSGQLNLTYTGAASGNLNWNSTSSSTWDILNSLNWHNTGTSATDRYYQGDTVTFDNTAGLQTSVVLETTVSPGSIVVNSESSGNNYGFSGVGGIAGAATTLTKSGSSTLTLSTNNTYAGGTTLNGGTIVLGNASALGTGTATLNGGTLNLNGQTIANALNLNGGALTGSGTVDGVVSGGSLAKSDATLLQLTGANSYSGGTVISAGTVAMGRANGTNTNLGSGAVTVNAGGTLRVGYFVTSNQNVSTTGNQISLNGGTILADDGNQHLTGNVDVTGLGGTLGSTYNAGNNSAAERDKGLALDGVVSGNGALTIQHSRISTGNTWITSFVAFSNNANTYSGTITVNQNTTTSEGGVYLGVNGSAALANASVVLPSNVPGSARKFGNSPIVFKTGLGTATLGSLSGAGDVVLTGYDQYNHAYGTDAIGLTVGGNGASTSYSGILSGGGGLTKTGSGEMTLTNASTYTGATTVNAGKLVVNGSVSTSVLTTVSGTGTLGGIGTVGALTATAGGTVAPGNSPGILNAGNTSLESGSTLSIEINGDTVGSRYDQLNVTGSVSLAGLLNVSLGYTPAENSLFFILANDGADPVSGEFSGLSEGSVFNVGGTDFRISYTADSGSASFTGGNDVALKVIPEASSALLLGLGSLGLALRRRRA